MAYCPDDGIEMKAICLDYHACYDCRECGAHWSYADGSWVMETTGKLPCSQPLYYLPNQNKVAV